MKLNLFEESILSFSLGVIFGLFGSYSLYYFLGFLILEIIYVIKNKCFDPESRIIVVGLSILGYIISRAVLGDKLFHDH